MLGIGRDGAGPRHLEIQGGNEAMRPSDLLMEHRRGTVTRMIDRHGDLEGQNLNVKITDVTEPYFRNGKSYELQP